MANPHYAKTLDSFEARVQDSKDRLIAIPAATQARLGLGRRPDNHIVCYSIRKARAGRWNHHYAKLTYDNEFAVPSNVVGIQAGDAVEVKLHRFIPDVDAFAPPTGAVPETGGAALLALAELAGDDPRQDGSERVDEELYGG